MRKIGSKPKAETHLLSPFRYPGGKTWLRPIIRQWLRGNVDVLSEPFAGGGIVSLTALNENLAKRVVMTERDPAVASVWQGILNGECDWLCARINRFKPSRKAVCRILDRPKKNNRDLIWATILRNRMSHGGLIAPGSGLLKKGESGKGIRSRWYPKTLTNRIRAIHALKNRITFRRANALRSLSQHVRKKRKPRIAYFIDPPYSTAGRRLYAFGRIDHQKLFELAAKLPGKILLTYDDTAEIRSLARKIGFKYRRIPMRSKHHVRKRELLISRHFKWLKHR